jgi:hypothetical protein
MVDAWTTKPLERRAEEAVRLAYLARYWVNAHPSDASSVAIRRTLVTSLKEDAQIARTNNRPGLEAKFLVARLELEPSDEQALQRLGELQRIFGRRAGRGNKEN